MKNNITKFFYGVNLDDNKIIEFKNSEFVFSKEQTFKKLLQASLKSGLQIPHSFTMYANFLPNSLQLLFYHNQEKIAVCYCFQQEQDQNQNKGLFSDIKFPQDAQYPCFMFKKLICIDQNKYDFISKLLPVFALAYFTCKK